MSIYDAERSADELAQALRESRPPIIGRITDGKVLLDLRTVEPNEEADILKALVRLANKTS
jgi:L-seryl-tRNA(Ser) seleniumtransferase